MKNTITKTIATFLLSLVLFSTMTFAEGDIPIGNRNCTPGVMPACPTPTPTPGLYEPSATSSNEDPIFSAVKDFLNYLFG